MQVNQKQKLISITECIISSCRFNWEALRARGGFPRFIGFACLGFKLFPLFKTSQSLFKATKQVLQQIDTILRRISNDSNNYSLSRTDVEVKNQGLEYLDLNKSTELTDITSHDPLIFLHFLYFFIYFFNTLLSTYHPIYIYTYCACTHIIVIFK